MTHLNLTPRAQRAIAFAEKEAVRLGVDYVGTEHLLLGLLNEGEGIGAAILESEIGGSRLRQVVEFIVGHRPEFPEPRKR